MTDDDVAFVDVWSYIYGWAQTRKIEVHPGSWGHTNYKPSQPSLFIKLVYEKVVVGRPGIFLSSFLLVAAFWGQQNGSGREGDTLQKPFKGNVHFKWVLQTESLVKGRGEQGITFILTADRYTVKVKKMQSSSAIPSASDLKGEERERNLWNHLHICQLNCWWSKKSHC